MGAWRWGVGRSEGHEEKSVPGSDSPIDYRDSLPYVLVVTRWFFLFFFPGLLGAQEIAPEQREFFESRIRPVLAQDCYECHRTGGKKKGGLALDSRAAMEEGGDSEGLFDFENPEQSYLIKVIRHQEEGMEMPKDGAKLNDRIIADFVAWIGMGAPDPRDQPPSDDEVENDRRWEQVRERRQEWWSFQPVRAVDPPDGEGTAIDRFLNEKIAGAGLTRSSRAGERVLVRRLSFALRGLPPTVGEVERYLAEQRPDRWERLVAEFLASPRFGERWARHWMDWIRYADSHGSEGDPAIRDAWRYRDYLIRALNDNVSYDTLVREHLAGDLLENPRIKDGRNESALGPAHLRMVFHGFAPTDALDEKVRFTDDQINVVTKAFQGLTVSCARCHNHKFDAISQEDYYALFGIFGSTKPGVVRVDAVDETATRGRMTALKKQLKENLIGDWIGTLPQWSGHFLAEQDRFIVESRKKNELIFLQAWDDGRKEGGFARGKARKPAGGEGWRGSELEGWTQHGEGLQGETASGGFSIAAEGESLLSAIHQAGLHSHGLSSKDRGIALSPRIELEGGEEVWLKVRGWGNAVVRYAVQNYPRNGTVFPSSQLRDGQWRWIRHDLDYWKGDRIHLEVTTSRDQAILSGDDDRSAFALAAALVVKQGEPTPPDLERQRMEHFLASRYRDNEELSAFFRRLVLEALEDWQADRLSDDQALLLDELVQTGILPNRATMGGELLQEFRKLEQSLAVPVRAPGVWEADSHDQEFFVRGDHKKPAQPVKRRFLEAIDDEPYDPSGSGRSELARDFLRPDNPFTARVIVNRVWHHLFGAGLVRTPDNFGRLGEAPTHPGLLDHLATRFVEDGWDLKKLIRSIVLTEAWQRSSVPHSLARERDPGNRLLSHFTMRRLEAEAIRDTLIAVSGGLDDTAYGKPVEGMSRRRSVYVRTQRNRLDPFLQTFNAPLPLGGKGRRDETNVPAQSLTLLNSPWVGGLARDWAERLPGNSTAEKVREAFKIAYSREPSQEELKATLAFLKRMDGEREARDRERADLDAQIAGLEAGISALESAARTRLKPRPVPAEAGPGPMARWDFEKDARDQTGSLHGHLHGGAKTIDGALVVGRGQGYFTSGPLDRDLGEKTLQVLVTLDHLEQQGGGVLGVQTLDGHIFDTIVYAETDAGEWLPGSEFHRRTRPLQGPREGAAHREAVWITISYAADGTIRAYRNAQPYGRGYRPGELQRFPKGGAQVIIGNRHGPPGAGRLLSGRIAEARLFDRALSAEEVALAIGMPLPPSREVVLRQLTAPERGRLGTAEEQLKDLLRRRAEQKEGSQAPLPLFDLTHGLFNSKELIYVR